MYLDSHPDFIAEQDENDSNEELPLVENADGSKSPNVEDDVGDEGNTNLDTFKTRGLGYNDDRQMIE